MGITTQQGLVLTQQQRLYDTIDRTGEHLDNKAATILQAGGLIIALTAATVLPSAIASHSSPLMLWGVAAGFLIFIAMILCAIAAWRPQDQILVGAGADWDSFFDEYISRDVDDAYNQILNNLFFATTHNKVVNERKARYVIASAWLLAAQIAAILIAAVWAAVVA